MTSIALDSSLLRLPGRIKDRSARTLRSQFLANEIDIEEFLKENAWYYPRTSADRFKNKVQAYATASIVIEHFWEYLREQPVREIMVQAAERRAGNPYAERLQDFSLFCTAVIGMFQKRFLDEEHDKGSPEKRTDSFIHYLCFASVSRRRHTQFKGAPFPSMNDLPTLLARVAGVVPEVFERDLGRPPSREEVVSVLRHPSILRLFMDIMANDRKATFPIFGLLERRGKIDLNNLSGSFDPQCFSIRDADGATSLHLAPGIIERHRHKHEKAAARRSKRGQPPRPVLGCPVLYTGKFREMYSWTLGLLEIWI